LNPNTKETECFARRTIVWDVSAGVELAELPPSGNWNFAAAWSPTNPGVFATASFDGKARSRLLSCSSEAVSAARHVKSGRRSWREWSAAELFR